MPSHHESFQALGPVEWSNVPQDDLKGFLNGLFSGAQTVIDSIPSTSPTATAPASDAAASSTGRSRAKTDSAVGSNAAAATASLSPLMQDPAALQHVQQLRKEWKEIKISPKDNPHGISVYKLGSKDGRGAWFARRSVHDGLAFDTWKEALQAEFNESMKVQGDPGSGNIRGIGADKRVEDRDVEGAGHLEVFQLSAQFPGPTAPRDFITLFLTSDFSHLGGNGPQAGREYMILSKPCEHPECPPRDGIIRGQYESVEIIREIPSGVSPPKRSMTSDDLSAGAKAAPPPSDSKIEWLMVTRSDPGGSVPRFMIERGTPPGIVGDAGKFHKWMSSRAAREHNEAPEAGEEPSADTTQDKGDAETATASEQKAVPVSQSTIHPVVEDEDLEPTNSSGLYGMITGALGVAGSMVAGGLRRQLGSTLSSDSDSSETAHVRDDDDSRSDTSSVNSFTSALEKYLTADPSPEIQAENGESIASDDSKFPSNAAHEKELKRLHERRRKLDEKVASMNERMMQKREGDREKDAAQIAKAREKHEKEIAKQEAKYQRELQKLEEKRAQEVRKAVERKRKAEEREKKNNLTVELEKTKTERDIALKQIEILEHQVGELQAQNTMLVAKMGKMGGVVPGRERSDSASTRSLGKSSEKSSPAVA